MPLLRTLLPLALLPLTLLPLTLLPLSAHALPAPTPELYVNDAAGVLSANTRAAILKYARELHKASGAQLAVLTVPDLEGKDIATYAHEVASRWKLGDAQKNNGLLVLLAVGERKIRVEVGYGLEGRLPDAKIGRILDATAVPEFKNNNFDAGILALYSTLTAEVYAEYNLPAPEDVPPAPPADGDDEGSGWAALAVLLALVLLCAIPVCFIGMLAELTVFLWRRFFPSRQKKTKKTAQGKRPFFLVRWFWYGLYIVSLCSFGDSPTGKKPRPASYGGSGSGGFSDFGGGGFGGGGSSGGGGSFGGGGGGRGF